MIVDFPKLCGVSCKYRLIIMLKKGGASRHCYGGVSHDSLDVPPPSYRNKAGNCRTNMFLTAPEPSQNSMAMAPSRNCINLYVNVA